MEVMNILLPLAIMLGLFFVAGFIWMAKSGQYDDLETPKYKMLLDDKVVENNKNILNKMDERKENT